MYLVFKFVRLPKQEVRRVAAFLAHREWDTTTLQDTVRYDTLDTDAATKSICIYFVFR